MLACVLLTLLVSTTYLMAMPATPDTGDACPITLPNGIGPRGEVASDTWHYQNGLYFRTDEPGVTYAKTDNDGDSGGIKVTLFMAVNSDKLEVVATHLDSGAMADTRLEPAFGRETPLWVGGIIFPEDGCWQISFTTTTASMTMVMNVIFVEEWGATPES